MKRLSNWFGLACGLLVVALAANAQTWGYGDSRYPQQRGYGYGYGYGQDQNLTGRVMADADRAAQGARLDGHERKHFNEVFSNLQEFEARRARGKFDTGKLDKAIRALEHLSEADRVRGRDRDMLARDLQDLRAYRASRGGYYQNRDYDPYWRR